jgi:hypothetical protein
MRALRWALPTAILGLLVFAATGFADTYCVLPATGCDHMASSIQNGLDLARDHAGDDTVQLGATTYTINNPSGSPTYPTSGAMGAVTLRGAGMGQTTLQQTLAVLGGEALIGGTAGSTGNLNVRDLRVLVSGSTNGYAIDTQGTLFDHVAVEMTGTGLTGMQLHIPGAAVTNSTFTFPVASDAYCVQVNPNSAVDTTLFSIADDVFNNCSLHTSGNPHVQIDRARLTHRQGIDTASGAVVTINDSLMQITGTGVFAVSAGAGAPTGTTVTVNQSTIVGNGTGAGLRSVGSPGSGTAKIQAYDTIVRGFANSMSVNTGGGTATVNGDYVAYKFSTVTGPTNITHGYDDPNPMFVSGSDFRLQPGSPLIDQDPTALTPFEPSTDLAGNARIQGGKRDLGAYELPVPGGGGGTGTGGTVDTKKPVISGLKAKKKKGKLKSFDFTSSEGGSATFKFTKKKGRKYKSAGSQTKTAKAGKNSIKPKKLRKGSYKLTLTVKDAAGNVSAAGKLSFTVR